MQNTFRKFSTLFFTKLPEKWCRVMILAGIATVVLSGCGEKKTAYFLEENETQTKSAVEETASLKNGSEQNAFSEGQAAEQEETGTESCFVHICGAVRSPGVYELAVGSRVFEVVELADGFTEDACREYLNQAQEIADGMKIYVPTVEQVKEGEIPSSAEEAATAKEEQSGLVNINTAGKDLLMTLPGIGESRAESIIAYRQEHGEFNSIEDIMLVSGIKEGAYQKLKEHICVK